MLMIGEVVVSSGYVQAIESILGVVAKDAMSRRLRVEVFLKRDQHKPRPHTHRCSWAEAIVEGVGAVTQ